MYSRIFRSRILHSHVFSPALPHSRTPAFYQHPSSNGYCRPDVLRRTGLACSFTTPLDFSDADSTSNSQTQITAGIIYARLAAVLASSRATLSSRPPRSRSSKRDVLSASCRHSSSRSSNKPSACRARQASSRQTPTRASAVAISTASSL